MYEQANSSCFQQMAQRQPLREVDIFSLRRTEASQSLIDFWMAVLQNSHNLVGNSPFAVGHQYMRHTLISRLWQRTNTTVHGKWYTTCNLPVTQLAVKVIWRTATLLLQTDDSVVFARWRQCAPHLVHHNRYRFWPLLSCFEYIDRWTCPGMTWNSHFSPQNCPLTCVDLESNTWFLGPTRVHSPNIVSISSAASARLTTVTDHATPSVATGHIYIVLSCGLVITVPQPPQPFYSPLSGTTQVSRCQKRTSGHYGARED